jgi:membrane complex biogenesis BtpA family protein
MTWLKEVIGKNKAVIGMVHFPPLPGTPLFDEKRGVKFLIERIEHDALVLQENGIDAVMFCNENDRPYVNKVSYETPATMARCIAAVTPRLHIPFGVDVIWDPQAAIAIAMATGGVFVREVFTGAYAGDNGIWHTDAGAALRYRRHIGASHIKLFFNINAEFAAPLAPRPLGDVAHSVVFSALADAICVSGPMTGKTVRMEDLCEVKVAIPDTVVFVNTGTRPDNVAERLAVVDGAFVGTGLKVDGYTWNEVDPARVAEYMKVVSTIPNRN